MTADQDRSVGYRGGNCWRAEAIAGLDDAARTPAQCHLSVPAPVVWRSW
ncbi:hypothetical protein [Mycobacterium riyadhense]|nr:hypothetical protein [Mycobacterium riyadhense]MCV7148545.1 hypothetical protein [Mycobacterium riyadhense]